MKTSILTVNIAIRKWCMPLLVILFRAGFILLRPHHVSDSEMVLYAAMHNLAAYWQG